MTVMRSYTRHLPHQAPQGHPIFLTWNLKVRIPVEVAVELRQKRERLERQPPRPGETGDQSAHAESKILFAAADRYLDEAVDRPMHLKDPGAAKIAEDAILFGASERYELFAWCVMSNHVHVLLTPNWCGADKAASEGSQASAPDAKSANANRIP